MRDEPGARRAGLSRDAIGAAAVAIADDKGFEAVSMRRVAAELGAGTMSLYHYVSNKDELLSLMSNAVMGDLLIPNDDVPEDWREALTEIARRTRETFRRHPWIFEGMRQPGQPTPNGLRHFEQSMAAVSGLDLPARDRLELVGMVDDYVFGYSLRELLQEIAESEGDPDHSEPALDFFESQIESGEYPNVRKLFRGNPREAMRRMIESFSGEQQKNRRFEKGLSILLDGIAAEVQSKLRKRS